jgi:hypothetical protein
MHILFFITTLLFSTVSVFAQRFCGTHILHEEMMASDPEYAARYAAWEAARTNGEMPGFHNVNDEIIIPVVFHIVWNTPVQNISEQRINEQIAALNRDFQGRNADSTSIPLEFYPLWGKLNIRFVLANRDPLGNPTNGILRKQTSVTSFNFQGSNRNDMKSSATGGSDAWNTRYYLNIWVAPLSGGALGFATFPASAGSSTDGVVIDYRYVGTTGASVPFNLGRTTVHEVGHWLNLLHIWGDDGSACTGSDQVDDTPNQAGPNYGCPSFPRTDPCSPSPPGVMFMNYMDYVDDRCMVMFTQGQATRMLNVFNGPRADILNSTGYIAPKTNDIAISSVSSPLNPQCDNTFRPTATFTNIGANTLASFTANYKIGDGPVVSQQWVGILNPGSSTIVAFNESVTLDDGNYTIEVFSTNPNGASDGDTRNDTIKRPFIVGVAERLSPPVSEGFEDAAFPNNGWVIDNVDGKITWERTTRARRNGSASVYINNFDYDPETLGVTFGQRDDLITPFIDLTNASTARLSFSIAAAQFTDLNTPTNNWDTLQIFVSTDCGLTRTKVYEKSKNSLVTTTLPTTVPFVPTSTQWRTEEVNLTPFTGKDKVQIVFRNISHWENNIYIDDVSVTKTTSTGLVEIDLLNGIQIFPNPTDGKVTIQWNNLPEGLQAIEWINPLGQTVIGKRMANQSFFNETFDLSAMSKGLYLVRFLFENGEQAAKKVLLR